LTPVTPTRGRPPRAPGSPTRRRLGSGPENQLLEHVALALFVQVKSMRRQARVTILGPFQE
jgi:hypothetical protein